MDTWVRSYRHELDAEGVPADGLLEETKRRAPESRRLSWQLLERYLRDVARLSTSAPTDAPDREADRPLVD
jgi:hypothetical protein